MKSFTQAKERPCTVMGCNMGCKCVQNVMNNYFLCKGPAVVLGEQSKP